MTPEFKRVRRIQVLMLGVLACILASIATVLFLVNLGSLAVYFAVASVGSLVTAYFVRKPARGG